MKNTFRVCVIVLILIMLSSSTVSAVNTYGRIITFNNNKIMVYQQLDRLRLSTAKDQTLAYLETYTHLDSEETVQEIINSVDICFILDRSGSMSATIDSSSRIETLKTAVIEFLYKLAERFTDRSKLRVGAVSYASDCTKMFDLLPFTDENAQTMIAKANGLEAGGGTSTTEAINFAREEIWSQSTDSDIYKFTILVTDGVANDLGSVNPAIEAVQQETGSLFFTLFCGTTEEEATTQEYPIHLLGGHTEPGGFERKKLRECYDKSDKLMFCDDANFKEAITVEAFNYIIDSQVNANTLITEITSNIKMKAYEGRTVDDYNTYYAEIDDELLNGALLEMEYSFTIVTTEEIEEVSVIDFLEELGFDEDRKLMSSNHTNSDYGWEEVEPKLLKTTLLPNMEKDENDRYKDIVIKVVLTRRVSMDGIISGIENKADLSLKTKAGKTFNTVDAKDDGEIDVEPMIERDENGEVIRISGKILPPKFTILDPQGKDIYGYKINILIILTTIVVVLAGTKTVIKIREKTKHKKQKNENKI